MCSKLRPRRVSASSFPPFSDYQEIFSLPLPPSICHHGSETVKELAQQSQLRTNDAYLPPARVEVAMRPKDRAARLFKFHLHLQVQTKILRNRNPGPFAFASDEAVACVLIVGIPYIGPYRVERRADDEDEDEIRRLTERWRFDSDDVPAFGPQGADEQDRMLVDDYESKYMKHSLKLLGEGEQHSLVTILYRRPKDDSIIPLHMRHDGNVAL
ncbi:hypothetical protein F5887DRAFT_929279 [Amanita rubescens]|nr:hypothetical protein F5887DRAFT_929279 [Amanita rubescens]